MGEPQLIDRDWLVSRRNQIQSLLLDLLERFPDAPDVAISPASWQLALGAAFALWRAVFLLLPETTARTIDGPLPEAKKFLEKLIDTNAIGFADERAASTWVCGYYLNDAQFRLERLMKHKMPIDLSRQLARNAWDSCFDLLSHGLQNGFPNDATPAP